MTSIFEPGALAGQFPPVKPRQDVIGGGTNNMLPSEIPGLSAEANAREMAGIQSIGNQIAAAPQARQQQPMNTVMLGGEPMSEYQKNQIALGREGLEVDKEAKAQALGIDRSRLQLDREKGELAQLKNQQIYDIKIADMERKTQDSEQRLKLAYDQLQARQGDQLALQQFREAQLGALNARHELELAQRERAMLEQQRMNDARIQQMRDAAEAAGYQITETELDPTGTKRTVVTRRGDAAQQQTPTQAANPNQPPNTTAMQGLDGQVYYVPNDKVNESVSKYNMKFVDATGKVK